MRQGLAPLSSAARSWLLPLKERAHAWLGPAGEAPAPGLAAAAHGDGGGSLEADGAQPKAGPTSEFSRRLSKRYNPRKAGEASGEGAAGSGELA